MAVAIPDSVYLGGFGPWWCEAYRMVDWEGTGPLQEVDARSDRCVTGSNLRHCVWAADGAGRATRAPEALWALTFNG